MKKHFSVLLTGILTAALLAGCGGQNSELVSKTPFPEFDEVDTQGNAISSDIFADYDATVINFWSNGCGTCIEEMPELEEFYHQLQEENINLIGVGVDSGEGEEQLATAQNILMEKGVTYPNISPNPENDFYKEFISQISGYPITYVVDSQGNIIGAPIVSNVKAQEDTLRQRLEQAVEG